MQLDVIVETFIGAHNDEAKRTCEHSMFCMSVLNQRVEVIRLQLALGTCIVKNSSNCRMIILEFMIHFLFEALKKLCTIQ